MKQKFIHLADMKILGISAYYHDSSAVLIEDGLIVAAAQEERFSRIKHDAAFPFHAIHFCLVQGKLDINQLDAIVFYDKPFLKFERILQTVLETAPKGWLMFLKSMPIWLKEKLLLKSEIKKHLGKIAGTKITAPLFFSSHHLSHAASAFYASPYQQAAVLTIDGVGEWATASIGKGESNELEILEELHFPHSLGLLYAAFTAFLGFKVNEGEYKVMGLAPYVKADDEQVKHFYDLIVNHLVTISEDGGIQLNLSYFSYTHSEKMFPKKRWKKLFGVPVRQTDSPLQKQHAALAMALQLITEEVVLRMAKHAQQITGSKYLCMAGGVALNCVSNGKLLTSGLFDGIYVQPASGDAGGALGAALALYHIHFGKERVAISDFMQGGSLGPDFGEQEIEKAIHENNLFAKKISESEIIAQTAQYLTEGKVVGWFQGRMEFGPRALGYRSILGDAANPDMQRTLNLKIKKRESFRPFAPIMLEEELETYFSDARPNGYMLFVHPIKDALRKKRPEGYYELPFSDMLKEPGSVLPAITHIDYTARIQTVPPSSKHTIRKLLEAFKNLTNRGVLVNTSFNIKDEPIVCTPEDAIKCFLQTEMDILVLENFIIKKDGIS